MLVTQPVETWAHRIIPKLQSQPSRRGEQRPLGHLKGVSEGQTCSMQALRSTAQEPSPQRAGLLGGHGHGIVDEPQEPSQQTRSVAPQRGLVQLARWVTQALGLLEMTGQRQGR